MNVTKPIFILLLLVTSFSYSQDYDFTTIDNTDHKGAKANGYRKCEAYTKKWSGDTLILDKHLSDVYYYDEKGLNVREFNYFGTEDTVNSKWELRAQYDENGFILTEQWISEGGKEIDSTYYEYYPDGKIKAYYMYVYEDTSVVYVDSVQYFYYPDSTVQYNPMEDKVEKYTVIRGDTTYTHSFWFSSEWVSIKSGSYTKSIYFKNGQNPEERYYYKEELKKDVVRSTSYMNGELRSERFVTYKKGVIVKVESFDYEDDEHHIVWFKYYKK